MSIRNSFLTSNDFEIINNIYNEQDILINHLENQIYKKEQRQKDFADIHSKYEQLQNDIITLNDIKKNSKMR